MLHFLLLYCTSFIAISDKPYRLVWSDEFNYHGHPDPKKWDYEVGLIRNHEPQYYTRNDLNNARVDGEYLVIEARKEAFQGSPYTSASLNTLGKFSFQYGRVEVRAKLPSGMGTWPAIWMMGADRKLVGWPRCSELDIMEHLAYEPNRIYGTLHQIGPDGTGHVSKGETLEVEDPTSQFHVYALEWSKQQIDLYVDDKKFLTYTYKGPGSWTFDRPMYLLVNLALGGSWAGKHGIDDQAFPQQFLIDYVRIYQRK